MSYNEFTEKTTKLIACCVEFVFWAAVSASGFKLQHCRLVFACFQAGASGFANPSTFHYTASLPPGKYRLSPGQALRSLCLQGKIRSP